jgi:pimeloyl-ACP methyl ester carboxylesterase
VTEAPVAGGPPPGAPLPLAAVEVGGRRLEYADLGLGPAVVLVHGGNCTAEDWASLVPRLTQRYRLILPDGLVHPLHPWTIWRLLDCLGIRGASLIGHSAGGQVVVEMYRQQPHRVVGLVTIDSQAVGPTIVARLMPDDRFSPYAAALYERNRAAMAELKPHHRGDYPSEVNIRQRLLAYARARQSPEERARTRPAPRGVVALPAAPEAPLPIPDRGAFIACPLQVFHTGRGKIGPEDISPAWIAANIRAADVDYVVIREASHWPWLEQPDWFLSHLEPFLARTSAGEA